MKKECNLVEEKIEITTFGCDKIKGSSRMEFCNSLIPSYVHKNGIRYLNVSVYNCECARVAEWLMQLTDTGHPIGFAGSIPVPGVFSFSYDLDSGNAQFDGALLAYPRMFECEGNGTTGLVYENKMGECLNNLNNCLQNGNII
jgi:hypothetical protein